MRHLLALSLVFFSASYAQAKKTCTDQPKDKWMTVDDFKKKVEGEGYKIRKFKQPGTCYEVYGTDSSGKNVEIYFNPVDGSKKVPAPFSGMQRVTKPQR